MMEKQEQFLKLFEPVQENLWRYCLSVTLSRDSARDLLQQTIETAYRQFESLKNTGAFLSYLFTIASRANKKSLLREARKIHLKEKDIAGILSNDFPTDRLYDIKQLYQSLDKLPTEQKEAIILQDISGFTQKEICEMQGISIDTLKQRLYRGRKKLTELMSDSKPQKNQNFVKTISTQGGYYE